VGDTPFGNPRTPGSDGEKIPITGWKKIKKKKTKGGKNTPLGSKRVGGKKQRKVNTQWGRRTKEVWEKRVVIKSREEAEDLKAEKGGRPIILGKKNKE